MFNNDHRDRRWEPCEWDGKSLFTPPDYRPIGTPDDDIRDGNVMRYESVDDFLRDFDA